MTMIILSGGIDLSVGSVLALSGAVAAGLLKNGLRPALHRFRSSSSRCSARSSPACWSGLRSAGSTALSITRFGLPPFVATLGMLSIARGLTMLWTGGFPITDLGPASASWAPATGSGCPMPVWISAALVAVFVVVTRRTRFGRYLYAVGGNERAAKLSGLNVDRIKRWSTRWAAGWPAWPVCSSPPGSTRPTPIAGVGYELDSIAAVVIGGTSLSGGRGSILGTVLGCLIIGVLNNGLVLLEVSPFWQQVIKGFVILVAVAIDRASRKED